MWELLRLDTVDIQYWLIDWRQHCSDEMTTFSHVKPASVRTLQLPAVCRSTWCIYLWAILPMNMMPAPKISMMTMLAQTCLIISWFNSSYSAERVESMQFMAEECWAGAELSSDISLVSDIASTATALQQSCPPCLLVQIWHEQKRPSRRSHYSSYRPVQVSPRWSMAGRIASAMQGLDKGPGLEPRACWGLRTPWSAPLIGRLSCSAASCYIDSVAEPNNLDTTLKAQRRGIPKVNVIIASIWCK